MKRTCILFFLFAFILSACTPASAPISTSTPSATPVPTATTAPTNTAIPTATPTPIPTIQVGDLSVPDPRVTNPELFDLRNPDAPIPQFANAMRMAGINLTPEQVTQGISYQTFKDKNGNPFMVVTYNFDPDPTKQGEPLEGIVQILTSKNENGQLDWSFGYRETVDSRKFNFGSVIMQWMLKDKKYETLLKQNFNSFSIDRQLQWVVTEPKQGVENFSRADELVKFAAKNNMTILGQSLVWGYTPALPEWLTKGNFTRDQYIEYMKTHIKDTMERYKGKISTWVVVNEAHWLNDEDFFKRKIGDNYIEMAFQTAREVDPSAKLLYSDFQNETAYSPKTAFNKEIVNRLKEKGLIDGIGLHMRINASRPPKKEDLINTMKNYGVPIYITELDVDLSNVKGTDAERFIKQAEIYQTIMEAALESGVCNDFTVFEVGDQYSWLETDLGRTNADATLFDDNFNPKPAYYAIEIALFKLLVNR